MRPQYIFLLTLVIVMVYSCEDRLQCFYDIDLPMKYVNARDSLNVGDTLFFESRFSNSLTTKYMESFGERSAEIVTLENVDLEVEIFIVDIGANSADHTGQQFDFDILTGTPGVAFIGNGLGSWGVFYDFMLDEYTAEFNIVPNVPGNYAIGFLSNFGSPDVIDFRTSECRSEQLTAHYALNDRNSEDNNYHLLQFAMDSNFSELTEENFLLGGYFAFVVTE